jgi:hypothetical protein
MDYIYNKKYQKYKQKYLLLKQLIQEGGFLIGEGTSGCLISPPIEAEQIEAEYNFPSFSISNFSFEEYNTDKYVGKILAIKEQNSKGDSYENELEQLLKIKQLDPSGKYTPRLIYANVHSNEKLLKLLDKTTEECVNKKITNKNFGYIISKNTGISLESKYNHSKLRTDKDELINFLNNFNELLNFIKILYDKNYLHLDIKMNNITVDENGKLYLIDFGRTIELKEDADYHKTFNLLKAQHFMYSFEPKIYYNLYYSTKTKLSFFEIINEIKNNFNEVTKPYNYKSYDYTDKTMIILNNIFDKIDINTERQQQYFNNYLIKCCYKYIFETKKDEYFEKYKNIFFESKKDDFFDKYKDDFIEKYKEIYEKYDDDDFWDEYEEKFWKEYEDKFWKEYFWDESEGDFIQNYEKKKIDTKTLLKYIFYPIIKKFDMYCMGFILAEVVFFNFDFDNLKSSFKDQFINLIKKLLFNNFDEVDDIINEIHKLIELI